MPIEKRDIALCSDEAVEARHCSRGVTDPLELRHGDLRPLGDLGFGWIATQLPEEASGGTGYSPLILGDADGNADGPLLVVDTALDRLPDPPCRVGGEPISTLGVELLHR